LSISFLLLSPLPVRAGDTPDVIDLSAVGLEDGKLSEGEEIFFTILFSDDDGGVQLQNVNVNITFSNDPLIKLLYHYDVWSVIEGNEYCYIKHAGSTVDGVKKTLSFTLIFKKLPYIQPPKPPKKYVDLEVAIRAIDVTGLDSHWAYYLREVQLTGYLEAEPSDSEIRGAYEKLATTTLIILIPTLLVGIVLYGVGRRKKRSEDLIPAPDPYTFNPY